MASANGFGFRDSSDSSEWVIASTPVAAVGPGGNPTVRAGSRTDATGRTLGGPTDPLPPGPPSGITPKGFLSAPVPPGLGTATHGSPGTRPGSGEAGGSTP